MSDGAIDVTFGAERVQNLWDEVHPLLVEHWQEITHYQDIPLDVDRELYAKMEDAGCIRCFTVREAAPEGERGRLIGYNAFFVRPNVHYRGSLQAVQDVLFVRKDYRKSRIGVSLITFADERLRAEGVQVVYQHMKVAHNFGPLLERLGYEHVEHIYAKRLDR